MPRKHDDPQFLETCLEIAWTAGGLLRQNKIAVEDAWTFGMAVKTLARDYLAQAKPAGRERVGHDEGIADFAQKRLLQYHGCGEQPQADEPPDEVFLLYACDAWKSRDSMRLLCASTSRESIYAAVMNELLEGRMEFDGKSGNAGLARFREAYRQAYIPPGMLAYGQMEQSYNQLYLVPGASKHFYRLFQALDLEADEFNRLFPVIEADDAVWESDHCRQQDDEII